MTAYLIILVVSVVGALALGYWKGRSVAAELVDLEKKAIASVELAFAHVRDAVEHHIQVADEERRKLSGAAVSGIQNMVAAAQRDSAELKQHISAEGATITRAVIQHTQTAVHSALSDVKKAQHMTCAICNKLSADWKFVEGKIECADCSIRKAL